MSVDVQAPATPEKPKPGEGSLFHMRIQRNGEWVHVPVCELTNPEIEQLVVNLPPGAKSDIVRVLTALSRNPLA